MLGSHCANCLSEFTLEPLHVKLNVLKVDLILNQNAHSAGETIQEISVAKALSTIFNTPFNPLLCICTSCSVGLRALFINYKLLLHRQRKESYISQVIVSERAARAASQKKTIEKGQIPCNKNNKNNNKSTQTDDLDDDSFMKTVDGDPGFPQIEIKTEAEDLEEFDEYSDPLQVNDDNLDEPEDTYENPSSVIDNIPVDSHSDSNSATISNAGKKSLSQPEEARAIKPKEDRLPTFEATYNLPGADRYSPFRLNSIEAPFISSCKCKKREFPTFALYREHVSSHVHTDIFRCTRPSKKPSSAPGSICRHRTRGFAYYYTHCVKYHRVKPVEPEEGWPNLDDELDKYLLPEAKSEEEEENLWCSVHPEVVKRIRRELKPPSKSSRSKSKSKSTEEKIASESGFPAPPYKCGKCYLDPPLEFQRLESYMMHMGKDVHETRVFKCNVCSREFSGKNNQSLFTEHCRKFHKVTPDVSALPVTVKRMSSRFQEEQEKAKGILSRGVNYKSVLELLGDGPYNCPGNHGNHGEDGSSKGPFKYMSDFWAHLRTSHFFKKEFLCPKCAKIFTSRRGWSKHVELFCGSKKKKVEPRFLPPFICSTCQPPREFSNHPQLHAHQKNIHSDKTYQCETCGNSFKTKNRLSEHSKYHRNDYSSTCELCGKSYKTNGNLMMHRRIAHSEEGRLKYNAYCRLKNQRRKMKMAGQTEQGNSTQAQNQDEDELEVGRSKKSKLDLDMEIDDSEQEIQQANHHDN